MRWDGGIVSDDDDWMTPYFSQLRADQEHGRARLWLLATLGITLMQDAKHTDGHIHMHAGGRPTQSFSTTVSQQPVI